MTGKAPAIIGDEGVERARWQALLADRGAIIMSVDSGLRVLAINHTIPGVAVSDVVGHTLDEFSPPEEVPRLRAAYGAVFAGAGAADVLLKGYGENRMPTWWESRLIPVVRDGRVVELLVIASQVTERVKAQAAIAESEARFRALLDHAPVGVGMSRDGRLIFANPAYARLFGYDSPADLVGSAVLDLIAPELRQATSERSRRREVGEAVPTRYETVGLRRDGGRFPMRVDASMIRLPDGPCSLGFLSDISGEVAAASALRASESRFQAFMDASPFIAFIKDAEGRFVFANRAYQRMFGISWERLDGRTLFDLFPPAAAQRLADKDRQVMIAGKLEASEEMVPDYQGRNPRPMLVVKFPMDDQVGRRYIGAVGIDLSERKQLESQLQQAQKMEAIGKLAGGIAHDFNNLLTAILGFTERLIVGQAANDPGREPARQVLKAAERAAALTSKLLAFSRKQVVNPRPLDLNTVVRDLATMLRRVIGEHIILDLDLDPGLGPVLIDQTQIEQVVMNLVVNARDAMPSGGILTVATADRGGTSELRVADTGTGLAPEVLQHLFEPFFTTKHHGAGTGLGLSTVYGIATQAGGTVTARNRPTGGAEFFVHLPCCSQSPSGSLPAVQVAARGGPETVLVVEDDQQVGELLRVVLETEGYRVEVAADASVAERRIADGLMPDLLLTDLVMPGGDGRSLATRLRARLPGLRVVLMSGYPADTLGEGAVADHAFLAKPFTADGVLRILREALDR